VYNDNAAETNSNPVPMMPEEFLKYFLPKIPNRANPANGRSGINAMYEA
jgi:hypothetical protein